MRRMSAVMGVVLFVVSAQLGCGGDSSQGVNPETTKAMAEHTDAFVADKIEETGPGMVIAVISSKGVVFEKAYGMANVRDAIPLTLETPFELASLSKQFTATGILMLYEEGKLDLEDEISDYFAEAPEAWNEITIHHVLSHQSGIPEFDNRVPVSAILEWDNEDVLEWAIEQPLLFAPGQGYEYANTGYVILALIIDQVAGEPFEQFMNTRVLAEVGMSDSLVTDQSPPDLPNRAYSYFQGTTPYEFPYFFSGMTNQWSSMEDLKRWDAELRDIRILDEETFALMTEPHIEIPVSSPPECGYGYGWRICTENVGVDHRHSGLWYGFINGIRRIPDLGLTIIILSNGHTNWIFELLRDPLVDIYREHETQG